jgi:hypothetical protein
MSHEGDAPEAEVDDIAGDVQNALNELMGGEGDPEPQIVLDRPERPRDETGRFAKSAEENAKNAKPQRETLTLPEKDAGVKAGAQIGQTTAETPAAASAPAIDPPKGWTGEAKAKWGELPEWAQKEATRREEALTKQLFAHDEARDLGRKVMEASTPYLPMMRAEGADPHKAYENYLQTAYVLRTGTPAQKSMALHAIAQQFNVDLSLAHQQGASDPRYAQYEQQTRGLNERLQGLENHLRNQEDQGILAHIDSFSSQPGHEHFDKVRYHMGVLLESGQAQDINEAYEKAIWADPEIRNSLIAAQSNAAQEKRNSELRAQTERARNAAVSVTGAPGSSRPLNGAGSHGSIEDDIRAALAEIRGRV